MDIHFLKVFFLQTIFEGAIWSISIFDVLPNFLGFDFIFFTEVYNEIVIKVKTWAISAFSMMPNIVGAFIVIFFFFFIAKYVQRLMQKYLGRISDKVTLNRLFASVTYTIIVLIGSFAALSILHLDTTVTSLLAGAGIVGLALSFSFQDIVTNFISGIFLAFKSPFQIGDVVETTGFRGTVEKVDLRISAIRTYNGQMVYLPNKEIFQNPIINYTELGKRRIDIGVGVSYGDDLQKAEDITKEAIKQLEFVLPNEGIHLFYQEFGDSSINFVVMFWVKFYKEYDYLKCKSEAIKVIKTAFDKNNITIPFPIRTLDFGIVGGKSLSEMVINTKKE